MGSNETKRPTTGSNIPYLDLPWDFQWDRPMSHLSGITGGSESTL